MHVTRVLATAAVLSATLVVGAHARQEPQQGGQAFRFRSAVELINVNATVTDENGRFVSGLRKEDFRVYQDGELQTITHFDNERVPVSLGILLDSSGSMHGERMAAARRALHRFLYELLGAEDEIFLMRFDTRARLVQGWTKDRRLLSEALARIRPAGGTALFEAVAEAIPLMDTATHRKKALVIISDGNDTTSATTIRELQPLIRQSEVLIYAIGLDSHVDTTASSRRDEPLLTRASFQQRPRPRPFPIPGRPRGPQRPPTLPPRPPILFPPPTAPSPNPTPGAARSATTDRVNAVALRDITDESGGRTEIIRSADDLDPATAGIADELSRQYYLGYPASGERDGRWHTIRVEVRGGHRVRARTGFLAQ